MRASLHAAISRSLLVSLCSVYVFRQKAAKLEAAAAAEEEADKTVPPPVGGGIAAAAAIEEEEVR